MMGKVARWLVILGCDARFAGADGRPDEELLEEAAREGRIFVTRDTRIPEVAGLRKIVVRAQRFEEQLSDVLRKAGLKPDRSRLFSRCTHCNEALSSVPRQEALAEAPPRVRELTTEFFRCPSCRRLYWHGTHTERTIAKLDRMGL